MKTLRRKLVRDLFYLRYQAITIAILVGCGIASFVATVAASGSMQASRDAFYADARFADVFAHLKRAPESVLARLGDIPGVAAVEARIIKDYRVELEGTTESLSARFVSLPATQEGHLNQVRLRAGRLAVPGSAEEIVLGEAFAEAWHLRPGSTLTAIIEERRSLLRIVGIAVAPEVAFMLGRTGLPDPKHNGLVFMDERALAHAAGFVGAFNDVALQLYGRADEVEVRRKVDDILEPYGGLSAVGRADQISAKLVDQKVTQLLKLSKTLPLIFLGVASFLLNVLLSRVVSTQREQIAMLKALGYHTRELLAHYLEFAIVVAMLGIVVGIGLGTLGAETLLHLYAAYFKFPAFLFRFDAFSVLVAAGIALVSGAFGALVGVRKALAVPAAQAMKPEAPPAYHATALDRIYNRLSPMLRMTLRDLQRRPLRLLLSAGSIALATALVLAGSVFGDSITEVLRLQFEVAHREQITVTLAAPRPRRALLDVAHVPGVIAAEGERLVPVRLRYRNIARTSVIAGVTANSDLHRLLGPGTRPLTLSSGLSMSRALAELLGLRRGDVAELEILEGDRRKLRSPVAELVDDVLGLSAYMGMAELSQLLGEEPRFDVLLLAVQPSDIDAVTERLRALPAAAGVSRPALDRSLLHAEVADVFTATSIMLALFAAAIAVGVVYNNARIALEIRSRDLATLRILGFTRGELATILLSEQAAQVVLGIAPGLALGKGLARLWMSTIDREMLRVPLVIAPRSYLMAVSVVLLAALMSALAVRARSDGLNLVAVLKARD